MAGWVTETSKSTFDASSFTERQIAGRDGSRSKASTGSVGGLLGLGAYSIVGMDITKVGLAIEKIEDYVVAVETHVAGIEATANSDLAFKSEAVKAAVQRYVNKVKDYSINLCSQLRAFEDKLKDAQEKWEQGAGRMADTINTTEGQYDTGTKYTATRS